MKIRSLVASGALLGALLFGAIGSAPATAGTLWSPDAAYDCYNNRPDSMEVGYRYWSFNVVGNPQNSSSSYCSYTYISTGSLDGFPAGVPAHPTKGIDWDYACRTTYEHTSTAWWFAGDNNMYCRR